VRAGRVRDLGWTPFGIDISAAMLQHARGRLPAARADAVRLPVRDGCLPAVITVMAHTDMLAYPDVLAEGARVLQPGGRLVHIGVQASWTTSGVRDKVGATHLPLASLMHAFLDAGLTPERFAEGGEPTPVTLAIRAHKNA